jgi:hypothetical protein
MPDNIETLPKLGRDELSAPAFQFLDIVGKAETQAARQINAPRDKSKSTGTDSDAQFLSIPPLNLDSSSNNKDRNGSTVKQDSADAKADKIAKTNDSRILKAGPDGKIELGENDFDLIGPRAKKALTDAGVSKISITPHEGYNSYKIEFKKPQELAQDPSIDGTRKLKVGNELNFDLKHNKDGSLSLSNIDGLTAESNILGRFRDAEVNKIKIEKTEEGQSKISSTGTWNNFSRTKVRSQPDEVYDTANICSSACKN